MPKVESQRYPMIIYAGTKHPLRIQLENLDVTSSYCLIK